MDLIRLVNIVIVIGSCKSMMSSKLVALRLNYKLINLKRKKFVRILMGILIASLIIVSWAAHLLYCLSSLEINFTSPFFYLHILIQTFLFTGLFITAHDSMHGTVAPSRKFVNNFFGRVSSFLFAGFSYNRLRKNHFEHHNHPGTEHDPDFNVRSQNFFIWWFGFMIKYSTIWQVITMAIIFNLFKIRFDEISIIFFWVIPALLSSLQLFYFGTYLPHKHPHTDEMNPHKARSQKRNHILAFFTCYFFGYHYEHHDSPGTPWWKLHEIRNDNFSNLKSN